MAIVGRYALAQSTSTTITSREEPVANLQLQATDGSDTGNITGIVRRSDGTPISLATVTLFNSNNAPIQHLNSNSAGRFIFTRIPVGSYFITASEPGFLTPLRIPVTVMRNGTTDVTITMATDPDANKNAVFGTLTSSIGQPADDATVELYQVVNSTNQLVGIVNTNAQGQYLFANLNNGTYFIRATKTGHLSTESTPVTLSGSTFAPANSILAVDPDANTGTISGFVTDKTTNQPIANAIVALYSISNGVETIVSITKTNAGGLYLFGDLPPGTYRVKSTVQAQG
ncbi:carboxypeptidase-like regulatory domain-containing protein [Anoxybacteroides tepidamans]|uniref:carboxypeptidase-like regulatory domain-containing protein n=1 Tax=Anoxybacteroides tepidamans TaxID=265948 RepID=UPI000483865F|nr:carboxypeptidase-like regulatory domain-containing protein [Anoxybacillus tepidamans]